MEGNFSNGDGEDGGHCWGEGDIRCVLYPYQPIEAVLVSDCLHISFQLGVELCISNVIRTLPCQEIPVEIPKFMLRIY